MKEKTLFTKTSLLYFLVFFVLIEHFVVSELCAVWLMPYAHKAPFLEVVSN